MTRGLPENLDTLKFWAEESAYYRREYCGVVYEATAHMLPNEHPFPQHDFTIGPVTLREFFADRELTLLQGIWHTHPNGDSSPSDNDVQWHPVQVPMLIVTTRAITAYEVDSVGAEVIWTHGFA